MEILAFVLFLLFILVVSALCTHLSIIEWKRQKQISDDLHYIREVIQNVEKENK